MKIDVSDNQARTDGNNNLSLSSLNSFEIMNQDRLYREEVLQLIDKVERNLQRDCIISKNFEDIVKKKDNVRGRLRVLGLVILHVFHAIRSLLGLVDIEYRNLHFYVFNYNYGYGSLGRFLHCLYLFGYSGMTVHLITIILDEKKGRLPMITDLKKMNDNLGVKTPKEQRNFIYYLKLLTQVRLIMFYGATIPMTSVTLLGVCLSARKFESWTFLLASIPLHILSVITTHMSVQVYAYIHLLIAQSTSYFMIRLNRIGNSIDDLVSRKDRCFELLEKDVNAVITDLKEVISEIEEHNRSIRFWMRDGMLCMAGVFAAGLTFVLGNVAFYYSIAAFTFSAMFALVMMASMTKSSQLYDRVRDTGKKFYQLQVLPSTVSKGKKEKKKKDGHLLQELIVVKIKFNIMRIIQGLCSRDEISYVRIGYTVGDEESFSPMTSASFVSSIVTTTFMFMNSQI
jgi:hypothetical protein